MGDSAIEWTDKTWNPAVGCTRISPGCKNCYAFALHDKRHKAHKAGKMIAQQYAKPFTVLQTMSDRLGQPLSWRKPCRVFVNSVSDLFHEDVPDAFIREVFAVMSSAGQHTFQVLTKRADRMKAWFADPENSLSACQAEWVASGGYEATRTPTGKSRLRNDSAINGTHGPTVGDGNHWPLPNVWLGVSVEDQQRAYERIPHLLLTPAAIRFLSCEPLLGPVSIDPLFIRPIEGTSQHGQRFLDWIIVGGESGIGARPCQIGWVRSLVQQCQAAGAACFVKQLGSNFHSDGEEWPEMPSHTLSSHRNGILQHTTELSRCKNGRWQLRDKKGGWMDEWPEDLRVRNFPDLARAG